MPSKIAIISQARTTNTRLPNKIFKEANGKSLLEYHVTRLKKANLPLIVATTTNAGDEKIVDFCKTFNITCFRGSEEDVLSRYYEAAKASGLDAIVRVTSDCPLIDGDCIKEAVSKYQKLADPYVYMTNSMKRTFPRGFDFEIFSFQLLEEAHHKSILPLQREHVTPYVNQRVNPKIRIENFTGSPDLSEFRLTVDEAADYDLIKLLIEKYNAASLNYAGMSKLLLNNPELKKINAHVQQRH
jgi:spore coat polysaccharide biosynthesis protein SpsF